MSSTQLSFTLRLSSGVKTVHLLGSWDGYAGQLPLSKDKTASKSGSWKGTFRFNGSTLVPGQRYWYYYIIDGYHVAHNPSIEHTTEPTTGRELNILDVPASRSSKSSSSSSHKSSSHKSSSKTSSKSSSSHKSSSKPHVSVEIPKGRPLSTSQIQAPLPISPNATKKILNGDYYSYEAMKELSARFDNVNFSDDEDVITSFSPVQSSGSSLSSRSGSSSPTSDLSGYSSPDSDYGSCTCECYGITRGGERFKIDCGGARCGYDYDSDCSYISEAEEERCASRDSRRHGMVLA